MKSRILCVAAFFSFLVFFQNGEAKEKINAADRAYLAEMSALRAHVEKRTFRTFTLPNQLEVLLIQDPTATTSAAAMNVGVGSLMDPPDAPGIAHFVEHMLFLGTEKYPEVGGFDRFLTSSGQSLSNAFTCQEQTNFYFEVASSGLNSALDRFAQFFISPLFNEEYTQKELINIDSEYTKNLEDSFWKEHQILATLLDPSHPASREFQGNLETLGKYPRKSLLEFYEKYYSANIMKLAVITPLPLDSIEATVRAVFAPIKNKNVVVPAFSPKVEPVGSLPRLIQIKSEKRTELELIFSLPSYDQLRLSTPQSLITHLLNSSGEGSLGRALKDQGLIHSMSAYPSDHSYRSQFSVSFALTENGESELPKIVSRFFRYIEMLRKKGLDPQFFSDFQKKGELDFLYHHPIHGAQGASHYAKEMQFVPPGDIDAMQFLEVRFSPRSFALALDGIRPEKMQVVLTGPGVQTDREEPFYHTEYSVQRIPSDLTRQLGKVRASSKLHFPGPNPFIPTDLRERVTQVAPVATDFAPVKTRSNEAATIWLQKSQSLDEAQAVIQIEVLLPRSNYPREVIMRNLYAAVLEESLEAWLEPAREAGLDFEIGESPRGYVLTFSGYPSTLPSFAHAVIAHMKDLNITEQRFQAWFPKLIDEVLVGKGGEDGVEISKVIRGSTDTSEASIEAKASAISTIEIPDFVKFYRRPFKKAYVKALGFGQIEQSVLEGVVDDFLSTFQPRPMKPVLAVPRERELIPQGKAFLTGLPVGGADNFWVTRYEFGRGTPELAAVLRLGRRYLGSSFYEAMRTEKSLGYVVESEIFSEPNASGVEFLIESNQGLKKVRGLAEGWIQHQVHSMKRMTHDQFETLRGSVLEELSAPRLTFGEKLRAAQESVFEHDGDWSWDSKVIESVRQTSKIAVARNWIEAVEPETARKLTLVAFGSNSPKSWRTWKRETPVTAGRLKHLLRGKAAQR